MKPIIKYEHQTLKIGEFSNFKRKQWEALIKLNNQNEGNYFSIIHNGVKFKQYVGVIKVDNCTIEILPKIDKANGDPQWQGLLTKMLLKCGKINILSSAEAKLKKSSLNLIELYFDDFLNEIESLIHSGLIKKYRQKSGNILALKGRLNFPEHIRKNSIHRERFFTTHTVYDYDHKIHQILNEALLVISQVGRKMNIIDKCNRVRFRFPECERIEASESLFKGIKYDRKVVPYKRALELARLIILGYTPNVISGKENMVAILFDMNRLWEEYVLKALIRSKPVGVKVYGKRTKRFWKSHNLEPDIMVVSKGNRYIFDAKWKKPYKSAAVADLRQVYTYARFWNSQNVTLLYPGEKSLVKSEFLDGGKIVCNRMFANVVSKENGIFKLNEQMADEIFKALSIT